ncbi:unnamed protein product [Mytilus coruscus]|uniref:PiggyBac transposable element-derived protein domain-containing protein n=1 Tax=Mytilus coruscus TaxID=42192 RepID=A0A6J8DQE6_MYTCO|nr:unnamed protein product [Mytilus coruscus]
MADSSDSEQFSDGESDGDFEVLSGSSGSEDEMNDVPMNANPWFRVRPPEIDYLRDQRFVENSGPQNVPAANAKPIDYFLLFLTLDFLRHIVRETNRYAQDFITSRQRIRRFSRLHSWFKVGAVTLAEMKGFISVILNMGLILFFSSINLAKELLAKGTLFTGTLRANRQMPNTIKNPVLQEKESVYIRQGRILLCAYKERNGRKPVRLISSFSKAEQENDKPAMICSYNKFMGGVDLADMMTESYNDGRKTLKVWKKVVFNLMHRMVINAYIIYKENTSDNPKLSRLAFTQKLIEDLAKDHMMQRNENQDN